MSPPTPTDANMQGPSLTKPWTDPNAEKGNRQKRRNVFYTADKDASLPPEHTHQTWKASDTGVIGYIKTDKPRSLRWFQKLVPGASFYKAPPKPKIQEPTCPTTDKKADRTMKALAVFEKKNHRDIKILQQAAVEAYRARLALYNYKNAKPPS